MLGFELFHLSMGLAEVSLGIWGMRNLSNLHLPFICGGQHGLFEVYLVAKKCLPVCTSDLQDVLAVLGWIPISVLAV